MNDAQQAARPRSRRLSRTASLLVALITIGGLATGTAFAAPADAAASGAASETASTWVPSGPMDAVAKMQPSWNLGNTLDAIPDETSWGNPLTTKALFDHLRSEGFHSVRIPVSWYPHQSTTAPYTIDPAFMARVKQVVDFALADGLYVEINVHHDSWQWIADISTDHDNAWRASIRPGGRSPPRSTVRTLPVRSAAEHWHPPRSAHVPHRTEPPSAAAGRHDRRGHGGLPVGDPVDRQPAVHSGGS